MQTKTLISTIAVAIQMQLASAHWWDLTENKNEIGWFKSQTYLAMSREQKMEELWSMIVPDINVVEEPSEYKWTSFPDYFTNDSNGSFCQFADEQQYKRVKMTHTQGVVAQVEWLPTDNDLGYTGFYETGSDQVLLRLSETNNLTQESKGLHPAVAIKFLRNGTFAENIVATPNLTGSESWDFFSESMKTRVQPFDEETHPIEVQTKQKKMVEASSRPFATAVGTIGKTNAQGDELPREQVFIPYEL